MNTLDPLLRREAVSAMNSAQVRAPAEPEQVPFLRYMMRLVFRWKKVLAAIVGGCLLIGLIITLLMTPMYTATTTLEIAREGDRIVNIQGVKGDTTDADQEFYQTQYGLLKSRSLAERIAAQLKLVDDASFFEMFDVKTEGAIFQRDRNGRLTGAGRDDRLRIAGGLLLANVEVEPLRSSQLADVSFTSPDPALSQRVANAWSTNFIEQTLQRRYQANSYARQFLESRLAQLRQRVEQSERAAVAYASSQRIINIPGAGGGERSIVASDLDALNSDLAQATADRVKAEARYNATAGRGSQSTESLSNATINTLRTRRAELAADYSKLMIQFEPDYPPAKALRTQLAAIDRSLSGEEGRVTGSLDVGYREAIGREQGLRTRVDKLKNDILDLRRRNIQYGIYQREADTNRQLYDALLQRYKEIGIAGGVGVNNVAIVDPADLPGRPSSPRLVLNMLLALVAGCALGAIAAFLLEQADEAVADPAEVERMVGLPLLGSVPKLLHRTPSEALADRKSEMVDAYLAVQTNLSFSTERGVPSSLAITSTRPAEGKSTTALALATSLARAQKKVVLLDGDMRSPSVHHLIHTDHKRGLSNFLSGDDEVEGLLHRVDEFGFHAITAGPIPPNAAELLTSDRLSLLIAELLRRFDHVVIDSPPSAILARGHSARLASKAPRCYPLPCLAVIVRRAHSARP